LSAWANRKAAVQAEADALERAQGEAAVAEGHAALAEKPEEEVLAELGLPKPEDMKAGDDFSAFMKSTVPGALRSRALRRLWLTDPVLANVDSLVDYGEDFTGKGDPIGAIKTLYQVGKGMLREEEVFEEPVKAVEPDEEGEPEGLAIEPAPLPQLVDNADAEHPPLAPRRRMRFEFVEGNTPATTGTEPV